jgi:hypothetical protein
MVVRRAAALTFALVGLACAFIAGTGAAADAMQGQAVNAGVINTETNRTVIDNQGTGTDIAGGGLAAFSNDTENSVGVQGFGPYGIFGNGTTVGVQGVGPTGVFGESSNVGVQGNGQTGVLGQAIGAGDGVDGRADNSCCSAVFGQNDGTGNGVAGRADTGTGVLAASTNGTALSVQGTFVAQRSGLVTVATGQIYKQVSLTKLSAATFIVATVQGATAGVWVQRVVVNPAGSYFRIYLNKGATANTKVGWFAIN